MTRQVDYYYDYVSPYSYLADTQLAGIEAELVYRPVLLGALMQSVGNAPPAQLAPRGRYMFRDVQRWADHYDVPYQMNPGFPVNTIKALRVALVAQEDGCLDAVHKPLFNAIWQDGLDVNDDAVLQEIVEGAGMSAEDVAARITSDEIKGKLRANTEEAVARGAFGAPTFFVGNEMYFGNDRLHFLRAALSD